MQIYDTVCRQHALKSEQYECRYIAGRLPDKGKIGRIQQDAKKKMERLIVRSAGPSPACHAVNMIAARNVINGLEMLIKG